MLLKEIISIIHQHYPPQLASDWDNSGLILGNPDWNIQKVLLALDVTDQTMEEAIQNQVDCIITHHPFLMNVIKRVTTDTFYGHVILKASEHKIALFSSHTNMDVAPNGINQKLSELFLLKNSISIEPHPLNDKAGLGQIGSIEETTLSELCQKTKEILKTPFIRFCGDPQQKINKVAIGSGSCSDLIPEAIALGADVIITSDLKYHTCLDFSGKDFSIIDAGHFPTEIIAVEMFEEILKDCPIEKMRSTQTDVFMIG